MAEKMEALLTGPEFPDREFIRSGVTCGKVYALAADLRLRLAGPEFQGRSICLATEERALMAAALLTSLAGGPPLLLPPAFSAAALARMAQLTGFSAAISVGEQMVANLPAGTTIITPESGRGERWAFSDRWRPDAEFLRIFTGGTTDAPQLWSKTAENIFGEGLYLVRRFAISEKDIIVATVPPCHIYGLLFSVIIPLLSGASVVMASPSFPGEIRAALARHQATILVSIPPHYRAMGGRPVESALRLAFSSAGMLDEEDNSAFCRANKMAIVEVYGSTETGGIATRNRQAGERAFTPFPQVSWRIREQRLEVRSPFLAPELPLNEDGFFITGDRAASGQDGDFTLLGRSDGVTKVGGKRVDMEEIRSIIKKIPGVSDCLVMALPEPGSREHSIAALVQTDRCEPKLLKKSLAASLESYALPRIIKTVAQIPRQANGKHDRDAVIRLFAS